MKFAIGTAQFKHGYGILNNHINVRDAISVIKTKKKNINFIDTAPSYGSEEYLSKYLNKKIKIITKIDKLKSKKPEDAAKEIEKKIMASFKKLNRTIECVLFHHETDAYWLKNNIVKKKIKEMIKNNYFKKIGVSCYSYKKIQNFCNFFSFEVFQFPLNVLNLDKNKIKLLKKLKKTYHFQIHARSIFLQGILLVNEKKIPKKLTKIKNKIININKIAKIKNVEVQDYLISAIDNLDLVDCAVVGIKNYKELIKLSNYKKIKLTNNEIYKFKTNLTRTIDPRNW